MGKIFFILVSLPFSLLAQQNGYRYNIEAKYKMTWQPDSTDVKSRKSEFVSLLIGDEQSVFCATQYLVMDSAVGAELKKGNALGPSMGFFETQGTHDYLVVYKNKDRVVVYDQIARFIPNMFEYVEKKPLFDWEIFSDTGTVAGVPCQKAQAFFGNRLWEAWFAPSIPTSEGPYKFYGLPGLIMKINDNQSYWNFELASLKKIDTFLNMKFLNKSIEKVKDRNAFLLQKKNARDNNFEMVKMRGTTFSDDVLARKMYESAARKDNNWIELYK